ncbi:uncharacterized protein LOC122390979 isoform X2 [Amphibalanus amphitrite]|uniref:uncharacterized protein LOC122383264 n=1 Tax=Amphibalanus amphitrite TaxID=1232801 RepID=UPI001C90BCE8|nr:uncharacterized protein LOC122383264 [Amphibalanus amphitrite]XP_043240411.1 uncharacterized protein LOC122390979 isoform X2 [Amphibalanus amphitrite]
MHPACLLLVFTLLLTTAATLLLTYAELTDNWEIIRFDRASVQRTVDGLNGTHSLEWILDDQVGVVTIDGEQPDNKTVFLVPMNGGIWTLCVSLSESQRRTLREEGFHHPMCTNYLSPELLSRGELRNDWIHRMQNLSISCALVSLILLVASALVGLFGVLQKQNSAVLITGFMYLMAAIFSTFSFSIIHFKRKTKRDCGVLDSQITHEFYNSRTFQPGWSLQIGWTGVTICLTASLSWILLARFMRYTPGSSLLSY